VLAYWHEDHRRLGVKECCLLTAARQFLPAAPWPDGVVLPSVAGRLAIRLVTDTFGLVGWVRIGSAGIVGREHELSGSEFTRYEPTSPYAATQGARLRRPASAARTP
jgi:hypothetical protein